MRKQFCYNVRDAITGQKIVGGTITADSMEAASAGVIRRCKIVVTKTERPLTGGFDWRMERNNRQVFASVGIHPEYLPLPKNS
jgi:hypothetical protein